MPFHTMEAGGAHNSDTPRGALACNMAAIWHGARPVAVRHPAAVVGCGMAGEEEHVGERLSIALVPHKDVAQSHLGICRTVKQRADHVTAKRRADHVTMC